MLLGTGITIVTLCWIVGVPGGYAHFRENKRAKTGKWTRLDRLIWLPICTIVGPYWIVIVLVSKLAERVKTFGWSKREGQ